MTAAERLTIAALRYALDAGETNEDHYAEARREFFAAGGTAEHADEIVDAAYAAAVPA